MLFLQWAEAGPGILHQAGEPAAAQTDMGAVVGQTDVGGVGQHHQVVGDDACFPELDDRIELAAGEHRVAQVHVAMLGLAFIPAGQARTHEQGTIETV